MPSLRPALALATLAATLIAAPAEAAVVYTALATPLTTVANPGGGNADGTGIWFNPLTGTAESRGFLFPSPLFEDGRFFLLTDTSAGSPQAQVFTQGFFSRGNGVIYASGSNLNPARFAAGAVIGPGTGYQNPGAGYPDLGPAFGNFTPGRSFIGLTMRDASSSSASAVFYGFADITVGRDYAVTLNAFAFENVRGSAITTSLAAPVPEPAAWGLMALGLGALGLARRRRATLQQPSASA